MQNFGSNPQKISRTSILTELSKGISELGEAFAVILNDMVVQSWITNPKAEIFDVVPESWIKLAGKPDKTPLDIEKLDEEFKSSVQILAESYLLFIARETENSTGKIEYLQYEKLLMKYRFGHYDVMNRPEYIQKVKLQIKNAFNKLASHG